jgi:hypothetical protein
MDEREVDERATTDQTPWHVINGNVTDERKHTHTSLHASTRRQPLTTPNLSLSLSMSAPAPPSNKRSASAAGLDDLPDAEKKTKLSTLSASDPVRIITTMVLEDDVCRDLLEIVFEFLGTSFVFFAGVSNNYLTIPAAGPIFHTKEQAQAYCNAKNTSLQRQEWSVYARACNIQSEVDNYYMPGHSFNTIVK